MDPISKDFPELTPYQFASNTPIQAIDLDGLERLDAFFIVGVKKDSELKQVTSLEISMEIGEHIKMVVNHNNNSSAYVDHNFTNGKTNVLATKDGVNAYQGSVNTKALSFSRDNFNLGGLDLNRALIVNQGLFKHSEKWESLIQNKLPLETWASVDGKSSRNNLGMLKSLTTTNFFQNQLSSAGVTEDQIAAITNLMDLAQVKAHYLGSFTEAQSIQTKNGVIVSQHTYNRFLIELPMIEVDGVQIKAAFEYSTEAVQSSPTPPSPPKSTEHPIFKYQFNWNTKASPGGG